MERALAVMTVTVPQVSTQAFYMFQDYPTEKEVHCFILVDIFYMHLRYEKSNAPTIEDMDREEIAEATKGFEPTDRDHITEAFCTVEENMRERVTGFTGSFQKHWKLCTDNFLGERKGSA